MMESGAETQAIPHLGRPHPNLDSCVDNSGIVANSDTENKKVVFYDKP